jgi:hypothetical protein
MVYEKMVENKMEDVMKDGRGEKSIGGVEKKCNGWKTKRIIKYNQIKMNEGRKWIKIGKMN